MAQQAGQKITYTAKREVSCPPERKEPAHIALWNSEGCMLGLNTN